MKQLGEILGQIAFGITMLAIWFGPTILIGYILYHFISKYW
jgi:hypothetical protein